MIYEKKWNLTGARIGTTKLTGRYSGIASPSMTAKNAGIGDDMNEPKTRYEISSDELNNRMEKHQALHEEPIQRAVAVLEAALDSVMKKLGVDVDQDPENIQMQMDNLGIDVRSIDDPSMPKACGFYVFLIRGDDITPHSWIGDARLDQMGVCYANIQWFMEDRLTESGGVKILG
jgi:hypothetical protein